MRAYATKILGTTLTAVVALANTGTSHAEWSVGGYTDVQFDWATTENNGGVTGRAGDVDAYTFRMDEAAILVDWSARDVKAHLDVDIAGPGLTKTGGFTGGTTSTAWTLLSTSPEAYVSWMFWGDHSVSLGLWDAKQGWEAKDAPGSRFNEHGVLYALTPTSQVGVNFNFSLMSDLGVDVWVANPYDQGVMKNGNPNAGFRLSYAMGNLFAHAGLLWGTGDRLNAGNAKENGYVIDFDLGYKVDKVWDVAFYLASNNDDYKNSPHEYGFGVEGGFFATEMIEPVLRVEYLQDGTGNSLSAGTSDDVTMEYGLSVVLHSSDAFKTKIGYNYRTTSYDLAPRDDQTDHEASLGATYAF